VFGVFIMQNIVPMTRNFLELRLGQSLTLTPALQQSIRLLQLSTLDLEAEVAKALAENPLLEQEGEGLQDPGALGSTVGVGEVFEGAEPPPGEAQGDLEVQTGSVSEDEGPLTRDRLEFSTESRHSRDDEQTERPEAARESNLREYLLGQLGTTRLSERDAAIVGLLIEELNDDGFLASPLEDIVAWMNPELGLEVDDFRMALKFLQSLDPPGIGARDLAECLDLQLQFADPERLPEVLDAELLALARRLCQHHLNILATGNMTKLREVMHCEAESLRRAHALIVRLNPRPGSPWNKPAADFAVPDVIVRKTRKGWEAQLNDAVMPKLRVNALYAEALGSPRGGANSALHGQLQEARWMIRNVAQRFETILRVSQVIVAHQQGFFNKGWEAVRPLTLKDVALELGMHESTISRATTQKYMVTPFGTLELKRFFSTGLSTEGGEATSSTAVQTRIQALIRQEDRTRPFSDSQLATLLDKDGITIARRTVAKYREQMRIPTAPLRKSQAGAG
jgi:RNA polymerase sigma-54 factor